MCQRAGVRSRVPPCPLDDNKTHATCHPSDRRVAQKVYNLSKLYKHACYLGRASRRYTPNEFYFVVPFDLLAVAVDELRVPGYGIATLADGYLTFQRTAKKLHRTKIGLADMLPLLRKATTENAVLRRKLLEAATAPMVE